MGLFIRELFTKKPWGDRVDANANRTEVTGEGERERDDGTFGRSVRRLANLRLVRRDGRNVDNGSTFPRFVWLLLGHDGCSQTCDVVRSGHVDLEDTSELIQIRGLAILADRLLLQLLINNTHERTAERTFWTHGTPAAFTTMSMCPNVLSVRSSALVTDSSLVMSVGPGQSTLDGPPSFWTKATASSSLMSRMAALPPVRRYHYEPILRMHDKW